MSYLLHYLLLKKYAVNFLNLLLGNTAFVKKLQPVKDLMIVLLLVFLPFEILQAQSLSVNTTGTAGHASSMLDVSSTNRGALMPRMTTAQRDAITTPATGLLVYNTSTNEFNYFDGTIWQAWNSNWIRNGTHLYNRNQATGGVTIGSNAAPVANLDVYRNPSLTAGTAIFRGGTHISHFNFGTFQDTYIRGGLDNSYVILNDITGGRVGVGTASPATRFHVFNAASGVGGPLGPAIIENNANNYLSIIQPAANEGGVLFGLPSNAAHGGIVYNNSGLLSGMQFRTNGNITQMTLSNAGNLGVGIANAANFRLDVNGRGRIRSEGGPFTAGLWYNNSTNAALQSFIGNYDDDHTGIFGGVSGWRFFMNTNDGRLGINSLPLAGVRLTVNEGAGGNTGMWLRAQNVYPYQGWFFTGIDGRNSNFAGGDGLVVGGRGHGIIAESQDDNDVNTDHDGGLFVVQQFAVPTNTPRAISSVACLIDNVTYKIIGFGAVSTLVKDQDNEERIMVAAESPEALFTDYGTGKLVNGRAHITIDPIMQKNIHVDEQHPLKVFIQLEGDCKGVYVTNKSKEGFDVIELQNGTSGIEFTWQLVASRADEERGGNISRYTQMRFKKLNQGTIYQKAKGN